MSTNTVPVMARRVQIIDGMKGPQHAGDAAETFGVPNFPIVPDGTRIYRARAGKLRLHLGKRKDKWDDATGTKEPGFEFTAVFEDATLRIPEYFHKANVPEEERAEFIRRLDGHPSRGVDFWDVADLLAAGAAAEEEQVRAILSANPKLRAKLAAEAVGTTAAEGFELPTRKVAAAVVDDAEGEDVDDDVNEGVDDEPEEDPEEDGEEEPVPPPPPPSKPKPAAGKRPVGRPRKK